MKIAEPYVSTVAPQCSRLLETTVTSLYVHTNLKPVRHDCKFRSILAKSLLRREDHDILSTRKQHVDRTTLVLVYNHC